LPLPSQGVSEVPYQEASGEFTKRKFFISIEGENKTGKTTLALTAKGPFRVADLNDGLEGVVHKRVRGLPPFTKPARVMVAKHPIPHGVTKDAIKAAAIKSWESFQKDYIEGTNQPGTFLCDSGTEVYKLARYSEFGDAKSQSKKGALDYEASNAKMRGLLRLFHAGKSNVIITHQLKDEWKTSTDGNGNSKSRTTGKRIIDGFEEIAYMVEIIIRTDKRVTNQGIEFIAKIDTNRFDPNLEGMEFSGEQFNLPFIISLCTGVDVDELS